MGVGDSVTSGCVNTSGSLTMRVEKPLSESMVTRILDSVENAAASKPKIDRFITRFSRIYTPVVVGLSLAVAVIPPLFDHQWHQWIYTALSFLVMSCPCALVLSVPLAFFSGIGAGSKRGILFKGGVSIEAMAAVKAVAMDKTGTVTRGDFRVQEVVGGDDILALCASCEQNSTHPIAVSILQAAKGQGLLLERPSALEEIAGHGLKATVEGKTVLCGNSRLMDREGVSTKGLRHERQRHLGAGGRGRQASRRRAHCRHREAGGPKRHRRTEKDERFHRYAHRRRPVQRRRSGQGPEHR